MSHGAITEENVVSVVIDHDNRIEQLEDERAERVQAKKDEHNDAVARMRLLWTSLGAVATGLLLNVVEHFIHWGP